MNQSFFVGFSPERINPGDTVHTIENIVKVTSGSTPEAAAIIDSLYASVLTHGTYKAKSIKIAEACKLMENCQRDIQIAFFNEMILGFSFKPDSDDIRNTKVADLYINLVGAGYKTTLYDPLVDVKEVKEEYNIKVTDDPKVLEKEYQIVVIGTHHKMFDSIDMNNLITDKGFICDIYGIHKPRN